jgi:hypothetical protein
MGYIWVHVYCAEDDANLAIVEAETRGREGLDSGVKSDAEPKGRGCESMVRSWSCVMPIMLLSLSLPSGFFESSSSLLLSARLSSPLVDRIPFS